MSPPAPGLLLATTSRNKADTCLALSLLCLYLTVSGLQDGGPQGQSSTTCQVLSSINNGIKRLFYKLEGTLTNLQLHFEIKMGWLCGECKLKQNANCFQTNRISCWRFYLMLACECGCCSATQPHLLTNGPGYLRKASNRLSFVARNQKIQNVSELQN